MPTTTAIKFLTSTVTIFGPSVAITADPAQQIPPICHQRSGFRDLTLHRYLKYGWYIVLVPTLFLYLALLNIESTLRTLERVQKSTVRLLGRGRASRGEEGEKKEEEEEKEEEEKGEKEKKEEKEEKEKEEEEEKKKKKSKVRLMIRAKISVEFLHYMLKDT